MSDPFCGEQQAYLELPKAILEMVIDGQSVHVAMELPDGTILQLRITGEVRCRPQDIGADEPEGTN